MDPGTVRSAARKANGLPADAWRAGLDDLAERCSAGIGIVDMDLAYESSSQRALRQRADGAHCSPTGTGTGEGPTDEQLFGARPQRGSRGVAERPRDRRAARPGRSRYDGRRGGANRGRANPVQNAFTFPAGTPGGQLSAPDFRNASTGVKRTPSKMPAARVWPGTESTPSGSDVAQTLVTNTRTTCACRVRWSRCRQGVLGLSGFERAVPEMEFHLPVERTRPPPTRRSPGRSWLRQSVCRIPIEYRGLPARVHRSRRRPRRRLVRARLQVQLARQSPR